MYANYTAACEVSGMHDTVFRIRYIYIYTHILLINSLSVVQNLSDCFCFQTCLNFCKEFSIRIKFANKCFRLIPGEVPQIYFLELTVALYSWHLPSADLRFELFQIYYQTSYKSVQPRVPYHCRHLVLESLLHSLY